MRAGPRRCYLYLQTRTDGEDAAGQRLDMWTSVVGVWANASGQTGVKTISAMQADVAAPVKAYSFRITYRPAVDESWRVLLGSTVYDIKAVRQDLTGHEWTDLVCEVGGSHG